MVHFFSILFTSFPLYCALLLLYIVDFFSSMFVHFFSSIFCTYFPLYCALLLYILHCSCMLCISSLYYALLLYILLFFLSIMCSSSLYCALLLYFTLLLSYIVHFFSIVYSSSPLYFTLLLLCIVHLLVGVLHISVNITFVEFLYTTLINVFIIRYKLLNISKQ